MGNDNGDAQSKESSSRAEERKEFARKLVERLKELSKAKGVSLNSAIFACGHTPSFLTQLTGRGSVPAADSLVPFADYFKVSLDFLFSRPVVGKDCGTLSYRFEEMVTRMGFDDDTISPELIDLYFSMLETATALFLKNALRD
ncbi:MAG: helix-turn-helix domain-containing protein [Clostridiales bacterium]|jgi:hypothetical protein|nr:helix-turn-helix domain-containing protein [Clostridiales bacterium]